MDLMGPMQVESLGGKRYAFVCFDNFSRCTWIEFIRNEMNIFKVYRPLHIQLQKEQDKFIVHIHNYHEREFENSAFNEFCQHERIFHEYSAPLTPQQNGIVE